VSSEIEERIHQALAKHALERTPDGYRLVHPGGVGVSTLRFTPVDPDGEGVRVLSVVDIGAEYHAPALRRFHPAGVQRLNALALHGAFDQPADTLTQNAQLSIYSNEVSAPFMVWAALTAFGQQLPLGQSTALATGSAAVLEQQRDHHHMPRQWPRTLPPEALQATVASLHGRGLAASSNEKAVWAEVPLSGTCPSRSIDPKAETALVQVNIDTPHPIAGAGYLATLSLPWPKRPQDPVETCRRLNALERLKADFVPRLGAWGLHGPEDVPRYSCFMPCAEPFTDLHTTLMWWQAVRAAWIRDELWVAGEGIDFGRVTPAAAPPAPAA
jgi:hypothetical protein